MTVAETNIMQTDLDEAHISSKHLQATALRAYHGNKRGSISGNQIVELLPLVPKIAYKTIAYLKPPLTFEDLVAAGTVGLVKAAKDYDPSHQAEFKTYAYIRIRGAILDELKKWNFGPYESDKKAAAVYNAAKTFKEQNGAEPTDEQLAQELGTDNDGLYEILEKTRARQFLSLHGLNEDSPDLCKILTGENSDAPDEQLEHSELIEQLTLAMQQLPEKKRQVILLYYQQDLTMKEIAEVLEITESRVSQIHAAALFVLSEKLKEWKNGRG
jgi:RNA polymerase sigma factor for flagellar operon FliA